MCSIQLEDKIKDIVQDFIISGVLFTALDVSNAVKQVMPNTRHREVRDVVRSIYVSHIETQNWARTPITVNLEDGTTANALLYHPLCDSWDLDNKYDAQKRAQTSFRPVAAAQVALAQAQSTMSAQQTTGSLPTLAASSQHTVSATQSTPTQAPTTPAPMSTARTLWDNMFQTQPSLFPTKS